MSDKDFIELMNFKAKNGVLIPISDNAKDYILTENNQDVYLKAATPRDLKFHACYFALLQWIWEEMPVSFKERVPPKSMYQFMKEVCGQYKVLYNFNGKERIEYKSISFGRMSQERFKTFVSEQISMFYTEILVPMGIEEIQQRAEEEFERLFNQLI